MSPLARLQPIAASSQPERIRALGRQLIRRDVLVLHLDDPGLAWPDREYLRQLVVRLFGERAAVR